MLSTSRKIAPDRNFWPSLETSRKFWANYNMGETLPPCIYKFSLLIWLYWEITASIFPTCRRGGNEVFAFFQNAWQVCVAIATPSLQPKQPMKVQLIRDPVGMTPCSASKKIRNLDTEIGKRIQREYVKIKTWECVLPSFSFCIDICFNNSQILRRNVKVFVGSTW